MIRKILSGISVLIIILGACVCMYPQASLMYGRYERNVIIREFEQETQAYREQHQKQQLTTEEQEETDLKKSLDRLYQDLQAYNEQIWQEQQSELKGAFSYEDSCFELTEYGLHENMIGTLWIPRMEVELPLYLGATRDNMKKGAAILGQTSMPLGGKNTNTVIAAHRGGGSTPMFRNIQLLQIGDKIQVTTPFDTLIYRVSEIQIILPNEIDKILIEPEEDLVTLITCHPYTKNTHRYLVKAIRSFEEENSREADLQEAEESRADTSEELIPEADELLDAAGIHYSETQILLEKYGTLVGVAILLYICISGIAGFIKSKRKREK